ncbi:hypothetical protein CHS0354_023414 [Potamilus streckersoni]|uniref:PLAT domain-containing protein n=1 Tax=Potamilus streckersoni TaxID=2493646 RepID=A0AAE0VE53_9BIVA|nr:hypothetical protein CHS0354_023414 [Potamilus streckersoni]
MASDAKSNALSLWNDTESQNNFIYYLLGGFLFIFILCFLITRILRRKEPNVMVLTSLEDDCFETEPHTYYIVVVSTSYLPGSSCNRNIKVFVQLEGEHGKTPYIQLKTNYAGQNILQRGVTDLFLVKVQEKIGKIEGLIFVMSTGADKNIPWRVRCVKLYNPCTEVTMSPSVKFMTINICTDKETLKLVDSSLEEAVTKAEALFTRFSLNIISLYLQPIMQVLFPRLCSCTHPIQLTT